MIEENIHDKEKISSKISSRLKPDEEVIFYIKSSYRERQPFIKIMQFVIFIMIIILFIISIRAIIILLSRGASIFSDNGLITLMVIGVGIFVFFIITKYNRNIYNYELALTNRILYFRSTNKNIIEEKYKEIDLNSIIAIGYNQSFKIQKPKIPLKNLIIISQEKHDICNKFIIYDVPNLDNVKIKIESVLWHIIEKKERWEEIKEKESIDIYKIFKWHDKELKYENYGFSYKELGREINILFKEEINFKFSLKHQHGYILTYPLDSSKIKIGPFDTEIIELFYLIYLNWKEAQKLLSSKKKLLEEKDWKLKPSVSKPEMIIKPLEMSVEKFQKVHQFLEPHEDILFYYSPFYSMVKSRIYLIIGVAALAFFILQIVFVLFETIFISFGFNIVCIVVSLFSMLLCPVSRYSFKKKMNKTEYFFTSKKIIITMPNENIFIEFNNISTVLTEEDKSTDFIVIHLLKPIKKGPSEELEIRIFVSPKNKKISEYIYNLLKELIKKAA